MHAYLLHVQFVILYYPTYVSYAYAGELGLGTNSGGDSFNYTVNVGIKERPGDSKTIDFGTGAVVTAVAIGSEFVCAIVDTTITTGTVKCWGNGSSGVLAQGNKNNLGGTPKTLPSKIPDIK
jgi:hypothetical protein